MRRYCVWEKVASDGKDHHGNLLSAYEKRVGFSF